MKEMNLTKRQMKKQIGQSLGRVKSGTGIDYTKHPAIINYFGCLRCAWSGTKDCPHGIKLGGTHARRICSVRVKYLEERWKIARDVPKLYQQETLFGLAHVMENMYKTYYEEGDLPDDFKHIAKLVISLTDKMRRQDEGIKIQGDLTVSHQGFQEMAEAEAKKIEERNNRTRPAEFKEEVSNRGTEGKS